MTTFAGPASVAPPIIEAVRNTSAIIAYLASLLRRLFPNLFEPSLVTRPQADLGAVLAGTLTSVPQTLAYGLIIGNALGPAYSSVGVLAALYGSVAVGLVTALLGGSPFLVAGPRASTVVVLAALIVHLQRAPALAGLADPVPVAFALACASVACAGLLQIVFAALRFGRLANYVPLPVVAGFINGSALLIIFSQIWAASGVPRQESTLQIFTHLDQIRPATLLLALATAALVIVLPRRIKRGPVMLWAVLGATLAYHLGAAFGWAEALGNTLAPLPANFNLGFVGSTASAVLAGAHGVELLRLMLPAAVSMAVLSTLDTLLATSAADSLTLRRSDGGRQLLAEGLANLTVGLFSMAPGSSSMVRTQAALRAGMVSAAAPIGIALLTLVVTLVLGSGLSLLPQAVMAGLLLALGIDLVDKWTLDRLRSLAKHQGTPMAARGDLLTMVAVVATTLAADLATAVGVGMVVALLSFVLQMAHSPIRRCYRASALLPRIHGDLRRRAFIERHGRRIAIVEMEGALFFGSAAELETLVDSLVAEDVVHLALDLKRVKDVDASGARTLERLNQKVTRRGGILALAYVDRERRLTRLGFGGRNQRRRFQARRIWLKLAYLGTLDALGEQRVFADLDAAVALCESHLALSLQADGADAAGPKLVPPLLRGLDRAMLRRLRPYLRCQTFPPGEMIFNQGDAPDGVHFLATGQVDVMIDLPGTERKLKVQVLSAGSVFGEMALIDPQPRSASIVVHTAARCYSLSPEALLRLKSEQSALAFALLANLAMIFAERLRATNNMLAEMEA